MPAYPDLDALLRDAKASLAKADELSASYEPMGGGYAPAASVHTPAPAPVDTSLWGRIKRVANYSPLPEDIGSQFAEGVDPTAERDRHAASGDYGFMDRIKSAAAGAGQGFLDTLRSFTTPIGVSTIATPEAEGVLGNVGHFAHRLGSLLFGAEGVEQAADPNQSLGHRIQGGVNALLGVHGTFGGPGVRPEAPAVEAPAFFPRPVEAPVAPPIEAPASALDLATATVPSASPKPKLTAPEVSAMLSGREKFASQYPDAALPSGTRDELDRLGVEYTRTQSELKRLLGMESLPPDQAADLPRFQQAARELGSRLRSGAKTAATPPETPPVQEPPSFINNERGSIGTSPASLADMLQASVEDSAAKSVMPPEARLTPPPGREGHFKLPEVKVPDDIYAKLRGTVAKVEPSPLAKPFEETAAPSSAPRELTGGELIQDPREPAHFHEPAPEPVIPPQSLMSETGAVRLPDLELSDPRPAIARTLDKVDTEGLGQLANQYQVTSLVGAPTTVANIGVSNVGSLLQIAAEKAAEAHSLEPLTAAARELNPVSLGRDFWEGLKQPRTIRQSDSPMLQTPLGRLLEKGTRPIGAMDYTFKQAATRAGFTPEEALRVAQQQIPETGALKDLLTYQQRHPVAKLALPIVKAPANLVEQGLINPAKSMMNIARGEETPQDYVRVLFAAGAAAGYYSMSDHLDALPPWARRLALAASGLESIPAAIGYAVGHAQGGKGLQAGLQELQRSIPGLEGVPLPDLNSMISRVLPRGLQQLNPDYWTGTKRQATTLPEKVEAKIPGLAQLLRVKPQRAPRAHQAVQRASR